MHGMSNSESAEMKPIFFEDFLVLLVIIEAHLRFDGQIGSFFSRQSSRLRAYSPFILMLAFLSVNGTLLSGFARPLSPGFLDMILL